MEILDPRQGKQSSPELEGVDKVPTVAGAGEDKDAAGILPPSLQYLYCIAHKRKGHGFAVLAFRVGDGQRLQVKINIPPLHPQDVASPRANEQGQQGKVFPVGFVYGVQRSKEPADLFLTEESFALDL